MTAQTYLLTNTNAVNSIDIKHFSFTDDPNVQHQADLSNFNGSGSYTGNSTLNTVVKTYATGGYLRKHLIQDSHDRIVFYSTHVGTTLTIRNTVGHLFDYPNGVQAGWVASGGTGYDGLTVVSVIDNRNVVMSGTPTSTPADGASITFSTSTHILILDDTTTLAENWTITENGYTPPPSGAPAYIISVIDSTHIRVNRLPDTTPTYGNGSGAWIYFTTASNFLTFNETTLGLSAGWSAQGNGYSGQSIVSIVDSYTVIMSDIPDSVPNSGGSITFTDPSPMKTLGPFESATFTVDYSTPTHLQGNNYPATVTVYAKEGASNLTRIAYNFININQAATQVPTYLGGTNGRSGYTFTVESFTTFSDVYGVQTFTVVTNDQTQQSYTVLGVASNPDGEGVNSITGLTAAISVGNDPASQGQAAAAAAAAAADAAAAAAAASSVGDGVGDGVGTGVGTGGGGVGVGVGVGTSACFLADAKITLANGTIKELIDLKPGDLVLGAFGEINPVIGVYYHPLGNTPMYKINNDHDCTDDEVFVTTDREFYCINPSDDGSYSHDGWGESYLIHLDNNISEMRSPPWSLGLISRHLNKVKLGIKLQTTSGERLLESYTPYHIPPETIVYNCVVGGSHTLMINGYAHTAWARDDDFDYDQWKPKVK